MTDPLSAMTSLAAASDLLAFCSPSAAITLEVVLSAAKICTVTASFVVSLSLFHTNIAALSNTSLGPRLPSSLGLGGHGALQLHGQAGVLAVI